MIRVIVDRRKWLRGKGSDESYLLRGNKMCCIGFLARRLGFAPNDIRSVGELYDVSFHTNTQEQFHENYTHELNAAYLVNDATDLTDTIREKKLKVIGKRMGVNFLFKY